MELRYYINTTQISEPIGFDDFKTILKRTEQHGVSAESSVGELEFDGVGFGMIQAAYNTDIDTELIFKAEIKCDDNDPDWSELYSGILDLSTYEETYNDYCGCKVKVGEIGVKTTFNNRVDTVVEINENTDTDIDGDSFTPFNAGVSMVNPIKKIYYTNSAKSMGATYNVNWSNGMTTNVGYPMGIEEIKEHEGYIGINNWNSPFFFRNNTGETVTYKVIINIAFSISNSIIVSGSPGINDFLNDVNLVFGTDGAGTPPTYNLTSQIDAGSYTTFFQYDVDFDFTLADTKALKCSVVVNYKNYQSGLRINFANESREIRILQEKASNISVFYPYFAHELLNKISIYIAGLTVKSDFYGRFNSAINPLDEGVVGAGAMKGFVTGLGIRRKSNEKINLSWKEYIKNLISIDNIGFGFSVEDDILYLRVENWKWFYNSDVIMTINAPANKKRQIKSENVYSRIKSGYKKSITVEELNAVDGFHASISRSSGLKAIDNEYSAISDFIADPFAIELTRRAGLDLTTSDWKYDDSIFVIALKMDESGNITVEQGAENEDKTFLSPETMTNVRLSPSRNALRFIDLLSNNIQKGDFKFTSGIGNTSAVCSPISEAAYYYLSDSGATLAENSTIDNVIGYIKPELITFEYPLTLAEYEAIKAEPYGQIIVDGEACYIQEIIREVMTGMCEFKLIPKF